MDRAFSRIGLTGKPGDPAVHALLTDIAERLGGDGLEVVLERGVAQGTGLNECAPEDLASRADLVVCVGGDGSLLHAARRHGLTGVPLVGVNLGRLGFLVDVSPNEVERRLDEILQGRFVEEHRLLVRMEAWRGNTLLAAQVALNDVVLHKADPGRLLEFSTHLGEFGVNTHRADGVVVATPTGSTAYALSGGGPILHPGLAAMVMVPICPHTLSDRPLVVPADQRITLTVGEGAGGAVVSCDGQAGIALQTDDRVEIERHDRTVRLLHPVDYDFFRILRDKLHWGRSPGPAGTG